MQRQPGIQMFCGFLRSPGTELPLSPSLSPRGRGCKRGAVAVLVVPSPPWGRGLGRGGSPSWHLRMISFRPTLNPFELLLRIPGPTYLIRIQRDDRQSRSLKYTSCRPLNGRVASVSPVCHRSRRHSPMACSRRPANAGDACRSKHALRRSYRSDAGNFRRDADPARRRRSRRYPTTTPHSAAARPGR